MNSTRRSLLAAVGTAGMAGCAKMAAKAAKASDEVAVKGADEAAEVGGTRFKSSRFPSGISAVDNLGNELAELSDTENSSDSMVAAAGGHLYPSASYNDDHQLSGNEYAWIGLDYRSVDDSKYEKALLRYEIDVDDGLPVDILLFASRSFPDYENGNTVEYYVNGSHLGTTQVAAAVSLPLLDYVLVVDNTDRGSTSPLWSVNVSVSVSAEFY